MPTSTAPITPPQCHHAQSVLRLHAPPRRQQQHHLDTTVCGCDVAELSYSCDACQSARFHGSRLLSPTPELAGICLLPPESIGRAAEVAPPTSGVGRGAGWGPIGIWGGGMGGGGMNCMGGGGGIIGGNGEGGEGSCMETGGLGGPALGVAALVVAGSCPELTWHCCYCCCCWIYSC